VELYGYTVVAVEGDFSSCRRVDDYVRGKGGDASAELALRGFVAGDGSEGTTPWL
jgi:erythromycin esterase-like protein